MVRWLLPFNGYNFTSICKDGYYIYQQKYSLVNVKLKWVKDSVLDGVVAGERDLKAASIIASIIASNPQCCLPIYHISSKRGQLGLPQNLKVSTFVRKYPNVFDEIHVLDSGGTRVPWFRLTKEVVELHEEELGIVREHEKDFVDRVCKLLMLSKGMILPLQTIDQLKWDLGLPYDYVNSFIPNYKDIFDLIHLPDDRVGLKLLSWNDNLAVSHLVNNAHLQQSEEDVKAGTLAFPVGFTRGFGLRRKCIEWLQEWQKLPYTCPYSDYSHLDTRTDVSEKRIVGVFHELLHLTVEKKTERQNVSNLRKPLGLPQKFTKVFERHPGIFYISKKNDTQTVVLREAYDRDQLVHKHPISDFRQKFASLMKKGFLDRSRGLYKKEMGSSLNEGELENISENGFVSEGEAECKMFSDYDSDDTTLHSF